MDKAEKASKRMSRKFSAIYAKTQKSVEEQLSALLKKGDKEAKELDRQRKSGDITEQEYRRRVMILLIRSGLHKQSREIAEALYKANVNATNLVNEKAPEMYAEGISEEAWEAERELGEDIGLYPMTEEEARLYMEEYPELFGMREVDHRKDVDWNRKVVSSAVMLAVGTGVAFGGLAYFVAKRVIDRNQRSMEERSYEMLSDAYESGKDAMRDIEQNIGLEPQKEWIATLDFRTRDAHRELDGQRVKQNEPFRVDGEEIWFPRDPSAPAYLRCNCRCGMRTVRSIFDFQSNRRENLRQTVSGGGWVKKLVPNITYKEWYEMKRQELGDEEIQRQIKEIRRLQRQKYRRRSKKNAS